LPNKQIFFLEKNGILKIPLRATPLRLTAVTARSNISSLDTFEDNGISSKSIGARTHLF